MRTKYIINIGDTFGKLTVLEEVEPKHKQRRYRCKCSCGKETIVYRVHLAQGITSSCGCGHRRYTAHPGDTFDYLTIIKEVKPRYYNGKKHRRVLCKCVCGKETDVSLYTLLHGRVHSCGCKRVDSIRENMKKKNVFHVMGTVTKMYDSDNHWVLIDTDDVPKIKEKYYHYNKQRNAFCHNNTGETLPRIIMGVDNKHVVVYKNDYKDCRKECLFIAERYKKKGC